MNIEKIHQAFIQKQFRYTKHKLEQRIKRHISAEEIEQTILNGQIIEDYPSNKYGPSCLIYGTTKENRPLHIQIAFEPVISIVPVYEPNPEERIDFIKNGGVF